MLLLWLFLTASVLSYTPWDMPTSFAYSEHVKIGNLAGLSGALCAGTCSFFFGAGSYFLVLSSGIGILCYWLNWLTDIWLRTLGGFLMLVATSGFSAYLISSSNGSPIGPGGCIGALIRFLLDQTFTPFGAYLSLSGLFCSGLILVIPTGLVRFLFWTTGLARAVVWIVAPFLQRIVAAQPYDYGRSLKFAPIAKPLTTFDSIRLSGNHEVISQKEDVPELTLGYISSIRNHLPSNNQSGQIILPQEIQSNDRLVLHTSSSSTNQFQASERNSEPFDEKTRVTPPNSLLPDLQIQEVPSTKDVNEKDSSLSPVDLAVQNERIDGYKLPSINLLDQADPFDYEAFNAQIIERGHELERVCKTFHIEVKVVDIQTGPVLTLYELELKEGLRVQKLHQLEKDLEIGLKAQHVRIVSPIPGKNTVGVELPNQNRQTVRLREVLEACADQVDKMDIPIFLGKDVVGSPMAVDLAKLPHLLIAGRTGTGKSVCLNSIIMSILMTRSPKQCKLIMIDPKMVELSPYGKIPHLMHRVVVDMEKAEAILEWATEKMESRYRTFARVGARKLSEFNKMPLDVMRKRLDPCSEAEWLAFPKSMPSIVIIADEMADLIMTSGKEVERHIVRLAQKSRAVGIHLVLATQKPTVDVVTGLIKSNLPARISFAVATRTDSHVVLDSKGAEQLLGNGDMLFLQPGTSQTIRGQGAYVSDHEIDAVIEAIQVDEPQYEIEIKGSDETQTPNASENEPEIDPVYAQAVDVVIGEGRASTSLLQRKLGIGYSRASRIIDMMANDGLISPFNPAKPSRARDILITMEQWRGKQDKNEAETVSNQLFSETISEDYSHDKLEEERKEPSFPASPISFDHPPIPQKDGDVAKYSPATRPLSSIVPIEDAYCSSEHEEDNSLSTDSYRQTSYEETPFGDTVTDSDNRESTGGYKEDNLAPPPSSPNDNEIAESLKEGYHTAEDNNIHEEGFEEKTDNISENNASLSNQSGWDDEKWKQYMNFDV